MNEEFNLDVIDKTFTNYKKGQMFDGVVVIKREDGCIFNIGGKNDAFLSKNEVEDYDDLKIGDRFKVIIINPKNEDGMLEVSKSLADSQVVATQSALKLKLGSRFTFVPTEGNNNGLYSKMGEYSVFVPYEEISEKTRDCRKAVGVQFEAVVTEIDRIERKIIASIKMLEKQTKEYNENLFWSSIFINKIVQGKIKKIFDYGAFVEVGGIDCFLHISNVSYNRIASPSEVIAEGQEYTFKVIEVDRENKKVALSLKALEESPKTKAIKSLVIGDAYNGEVVKILQFGAIIKLDNGASGLLHIKNATSENNRQIYEIVKLDQKVEVEVIDLDAENERVSFKLIK
ncbi:MAG: S1 RNA-binding domain-containing protein [Clostridiales bacterium]|nr:S1 RNA-binding domain-containing protein [Clostridiales bacterium]